MTGSAKEMWIRAMQEELDSLVTRDVKVDVTNQDLQRMYWSQGKRTKTVPARLLPIKKPLRDGKGDGKQQQGSWYAETSSQARWRKTWTTERKYQVRLK